MAQQRAPKRLRRECLICFTEEEEGIHLAACGHFYCLDCMRVYADGAVKDRRYPVTCPVPDCRLVISSLEYSGLLAPEQQAALASMETEAAVGQGVRLYCPNARCSKLLIADDKRADTPLPCPYCRERLCANCGVAWHAGMTCQAYQARPDALRTAEDRALLELGKKEGMKRCPTCGVMVQRTEGCPHMKCRCGAMFCYTCGKERLRNVQHFCGPWQELDQQQAREEARPRAQQELQQLYGAARADAARADVARARRILEDRRRVVRTHESNLQKARAELARREAMEGVAEVRLFALQGGEGTEEARLALQRVRAALEQQRGLVERHEGRLRAALIVVEDRENRERGASAMLQALELRARGLNLNLAHV
jgi:E3 ubiquitin-protein ligase RNF144